ncbi:MAG: hypothetical protein PHP92_03190 [Candidatus Nanoarchaeia archaeon]|nr:hypothetical protein [Candidatus Nanoarchaeia archaeon]
MNNNIKYTKDGKKVIVLGKLNNEQWIVQEIYVSGNQEIPMGESFVERTLLDEPAETWEKRELKRQKDQLEEIKKRILHFDEECKLKSLKSKAYILTNQIIEQYQNINIDELDTFISFITGQITHIVINNYSKYEIIPLPEVLASLDNCGYSVDFEGLKLISLFGCAEDGKRRGEDKKNYALNYKINTYRDGSGYDTTIYPCKSYDEARKLIDNFLLEKEEISEEDIETKKEYNLNYPSEEKIKILKDKIIKNKQDSIEKVKRELELKNKELSELL